jgi:hypothetical protein
MTRVDKSPKRRSTGCLITLLVFLIILVVGGAIVYPRVMAVKNSAEHLLSVTSELNGMIDARDFDVDKGKTLLAEAGKEIDTLKAEVSPYYGLLRQTSQLPWVGDYAGQVEPILEMASHSKSAVEDISSVISFEANKPIFAQNKSWLVQQINYGQPKITSARDHVQKIKDYYKQVNFNLFPEKYRSKLEKIGKYQDLGDQAFDLLQLVPALTGADKPVTYLVLIQNSDELRATGGFITTFGLVRIEKGIVTILDFQDSTSSNWISEMVEAPRPLKEILFAHYWLPRDANWSPSFPEAARQVQQLYYLSTGIKTDGVLAVHQSTLRKVLEFTGPVVVEGETVDSNTVEDFMIAEKMDAIAAKKANERKDFMKPLFQAILSKLPEVLDKKDFSKAITFVQSIFSQGDLLVTSDNPSLQAFFKKNHLDGDLYPGGHDYLMLVDSNLGYNKNDKVMERKLNYSIDLSNPANPTARLTLSYDNPIKDNATCLQWEAPNKDNSKKYLKPDCYWDYWRVLGAKGTKMSGFNVPELDDALFYSGKAWSPNPGEDDTNPLVDEVNGLVIVPTDSQISFTLDRTLPGSVIENQGEKLHYSLTLQKQPGIDSLPVEISIIPPQGREFYSESEKFQFTKSTASWIWKGEIVNSLSSIEVSFSKSQ